MNSHARQCARVVYAKNSRTPLRDRHDARRSWTDLEAVKQIQWNAAIVRDGGLDNVGVGKKSDHFPSMTPAKLFHFSHHSGLCLEHKFAVRRTGSAPEGVEPLPFGAVSQCLQSKAAPLSESYLADAWAYLHVQAELPRHRPGCLNRAFKRARIDGSNGQGGKRMSQTFGLSAALVVEVNARSIAGESFPDDIGCGMPDEQERGQELRPPGTIHTSLVDALPWEGL